MQDYINARIGNKEGENYFDGFWNMSFDGSCSKSRSGVWNFFKRPNLVIYLYAIRLEFPCTNNEAEYQVLIQGMNLALHMKIEN